MRLRDGLWSTIGLTADLFPSTRRSRKTNAPDQTSAYLQDHANHPPGRNHVLEAALQGLVEHEGIDRNQRSDGGKKSSDLGKQLDRINSLAVEPRLGERRAQTREIDAKIEAEYPDQNHQGDKAPRIEQLGIGHGQLRRDEGPAHRACHRKSKASRDLDDLRDEQRGIDFGRLVGRHGSLPQLTDSNGVAPQSLTFLVFMLLPALSKPPSSPDTANGV